MREITDEVAALAVQGPTSCKLLKLTGLAGVERLKPFEHAGFHMPRSALADAAQIPIMVSRTGFTGDLGYELWMSPTDAEAVWDALMEAGRTRAVRPIGSRALNMARIEAGFLLPKLDFVSAAHTLYLGTERSPLELGLAWLVDFNKGHFTGRRALLEEQRRGARRQLVGLDVEGLKPAHNALLYTARSGRKEIGSVTSATWSPTCKRNLALAMVDAPHFATGSTLWAEIYLNRELVWERRMVRARVVERPFYAPARRRATPPADF
jgi:aminomethyltransferase